METKRETVIIVDDDDINLTVGQSALSDMYTVYAAQSGKELFALLENNLPDLILLDIDMPEMDGYDIIRKLKKTEKTSHIPVIFLTGKIEPENEVKGLSLGAVDYITKPFSRELLIKRIDLHIVFEKQKKELLKYNSNLENEVDKKTKTVLELQNAILKTVAELVEWRDNVTGGHIERTQHYLRLLIDLLIKHGIYQDEISKWDTNLLVMSSQLHDVGKISIRDSILMKPEKLCNEEFEEMKKHTVYGAEIIRRIEENTTENAFLEYAKILAISHHERWDGKGYPYGLKGEDIPLQGRIMAIIDVYDALTNYRPYKKAHTHEQAVESIRRELGKQFDPLIGEVFLEHEKDFKKIEIDRRRFSIANEGLQPAENAVINAVSSRGGTEKGHSDRIRRYLEILIDALLRHENYKAEVSTWNTDLFLLSAHMHDVGKIAVADHILNKIGVLSTDEYENVKSHVDFGVKIVQRVKGSVEDGNMLLHAEILTGSHHEKWDGSGYPYNLKGEGIPLQGRIMAIVDVYEALTTNRPHRRSKTHKEAVEILKNGSGTHFDPELVEIFLKCEKEFENASAG